MQEILILNSIEKNGPRSCIDIKAFSRENVDKVCDFIKNIVNYFYSNKVVEGNIEDYQNFYNFCAGHKEFEYISLKEILYKVIHLLIENDDNSLEISKARKRMTDCIFSYVNFFNKYSKEDKPIYEVIGE